MIPLQKLKMPYKILHDSSFVLQIFWQKLQLQQGKDTLLIYNTEFDIKKFGR